MTAEDKIVEDLKAGCLSGTTYSSWSVANALFQRRYLGAGSGDGMHALALLTRMLKEAAAPALDTDIALKLSDLVFIVMQKYTISPLSDLGMRFMGDFYDGFVVAPANVSEGASSCAWSAWWEAQSRFASGVLLEQSSRAEKGTRRMHSSLLDPQMEKWAQNGFAAAERQLKVWEEMQSQKTEDCQAGLSHALISLMRWSTCGSERLAEKQVGEVVTHLCGASLTVKEKEWALALYVYDIFRRAEEYRAKWPAVHAKQDDAAAATWTCETSGATALATASATLVAFRQAVGDITPKTSPWFVFLDSLLSIVKNKGQGNTLATCNALCGVFEGLLKELPELEWQHVIEVFASA